MIGSGDAAGRENSDGVSGVTEEKTKILNILETFLLENLKLKNPRFARSMTLLTPSLPFLTWQAVCISRRTVWTYRAKSGH